MVNVKPLTLNYLDEVFEIEEDSFSIPWTKNELKKEIEGNNMAIYFVAVDESDEMETVLGYAGLWHIVNEGHITNIAVKQEYRQRGVGSLLVEQLIKTAHDKDMIGLTLEVRIGNYPAQRLYTKFGFKPEGFRKNYYADTKEDAIIMWLNFI